MLHSIRWRLCLLVAICCATLTAQADLLSSLVTERSWIGYSPRNYNPNIGLQPSETSIRNDLQQLYNDGWRHLYNYTLDGTQSEVPRIAKEIGFEQVLAGIFFYDDAQLAREKNAALAEDQFIDGYLVGNEGLAFGRYSGADLLDAIDFFDDFGKPITTTEIGGLYLSAPELMDVGDYVTVNIQPWFNGSLNPYDPAGMARAVRDEYVAIQALRPDRLVVIKEAWWPTDGHPAANEANQTAFYEALAAETDADGDPILFLWGESHDQPWKTGEASPFGSLGPDWGFYESNGSEKAIVEDLQDLYTASYPVNFLPGDFNRDGSVDLDDSSYWSASFGETLEIAGAGADANFDRAINAADYTVWRDAYVADTATAIPEPTALLLGLTGFAFAARRVR